MTLDLDAIEARANSGLPGQWTTDRVFVEAARADVMALIAEVRRLQAHYNGLAEQLTQALVANHEARREVTGAMADTVSLRKRLQEARAAFLQMRDAWVVGTADDAQNALRVLGQALGVGE